MIGVYQLFLRLVDRLPLPSVKAQQRFALAALLLVLTPGPNMIYCVSRTLCQGRAAGVMSLVLAAAIVGGLYLLDTWPPGEMIDAGGLVDVLFVPLVITLSVGAGTLPALLSRTTGKTMPLPMR